MSLFVAALCILAASILPAAFGGRRSWAGTFGARGACLGCIVGLVSLSAGSWSESALLELPWGLPLGSCAIGLDPLTRIFLTPIFGLGAVCAVSGEAHGRNPGSHRVFSLLLVLGLALVAAARDAVLFLLAWEIMSLAPFFLIDLHDDDVQVREASWIYLVAAHLGAVFLIGMFGLLWARTGSTSFAVFALSPISPGTGAVLFILALAGFGVKAGIAPFHVWLPEAHPAAPSHISAMLSGAMISIGLYGLTRSLTFFGTGSAWWGWTLVGAGVCTGLLGALNSLAQTNLKRLLACSSVENMGIALMGIGVGYLGAHEDNAWMATLGYSAAFFHILNHAAMKGLLFLCAGEVLHSARTVRLELLGGLQKRMPWTGAVFALGAAAISCLPPFNGFVGKFLLILALSKNFSGQGLHGQIAAFGALVALVFMGGLAAAAFANAYGLGFLGEPRSDAARDAVEADRRSRIALGIPAACCLCFALGAPWIFGLLHPAALSLFPPDMSRAACARAAGEASDVLVQCLVLGVGLAALVYALWRLRVSLLKRNGGVREARTWDCGYQFGTPRIQYSAASFVRPLTRLFAIVGVSRPGWQAGVGRPEWQAGVGRPEWKGDFFPSRMECEIRSPRGLLTGVFAPLFEGARRVCDSLKIVQHGRIHIYILYILVMIVVLLIWGLHL